MASRKRRACDRFSTKIDYCAIQKVVPKLWIYELQSALLAERPNFVKVESFSTMLDLCIHARWGNLSEEVFDFIDEKVKCTSMEGLLGESNCHVFIDDAFDEHDSTDSYKWIKSILVCLALMMLAKRSYCDKIVWIALDFFMDFASNRWYFRGGLTLLQFLQQNCKGSYFVAILRHNMRSTLNIFRSAHVSDIRWQRDVEPLPWHKLQGPSIVSMKKTCTTFEEASEISWNLITESIRDLRREGIAYRDMSIIVSGSSNFDAEPRHFLSDRWKRHISFFFLETNFLSKCKLELRRDQTRLDMAVVKWYETSSLEWPVVIYVTLLPASIMSSEDYKDYITYQKYRAMLRAISRLIDILVAYGLREPLPSDRHMVQFREHHISTRGTSHASIAIIQLEDVHREEKLGKGSFGKVFAATLWTQKQRVAIKVLQMTERNHNAWRREAGLLQQFSHPNIVSTLGVVNNSAKGEIRIIAELMNRGTLREYCTGHKSSQLELTQKIEISIHCWSALSYLHTEAKNVTHKDIKPENILVHKKDDGNLVAKLCDFGAAKIKETLRVTQFSTVSGTPMYFPPEIADSKPQRNAEKADVYSLGATLIELFTNVYFWHYSEDGGSLESCRVMYKLWDIKNRNNDIREANPSVIHHGATVLNSSHCGSALATILKRTVGFDCKNRPSAEEVLGFFTQALSSPPPGFTMAAQEHRDYSTGSLRHLRSQKTENGKMACGPFCNIAMYPQPSKVGVKVAQLQEQLTKCFTTSFFGAQQKIGSKVAEIQGQLMRNST